MGLLINNLIAGYGHKSIIRNFAFNASKGSTTLLLGRNGSGKSTFIKALSGAVRFEGEIIFNGQDLKLLTNKERAKIVATVSQIAPNGMGLSGLDVVKMGAYARLENYTPFRKSHEEEALAVMQNCHCEAFANRDMDELSGGEQQLVWLAQAQYQNTPLVCLDEPSHYLDWHQKKLLKARLEKWLHQGKTIVIASHDLECVPNSHGQILFFTSSGIEILDLNEQNLLEVRNSIESGLS